MKFLVTSLGILLILALSFAQSPASHWEWKTDYSKAENLMMDGRYPEAFNMAKQSLIESMDRHGKETANSVKSMELLSQVAQATGNFSQAAKFQSRAYDLNKRLKGPQDIKTISLLTRLAELSILAGNQKTGEMYYREALTICENVGRSDCVTAVGPMLGLARFLASNGNYSEAETLYRSAIAKFCCFSKYQPDLKLDMAAAFENLGSVCRSRGDYAEAVNCFLKARQLYMSQNAIPREKLAQNLLMLGDMYARWGKPERSLKSYKEALTLLESHDGLPVSRGLAYKGVGDVFRTKSNLQMASNYYKRAINQFGRVAYVGKPLFAETVNSLAEVYKAMGMDSEAGLLKTKFVAMN